MNKSAHKEHGFERMTPAEAAAWYAQQLGWRVLPIRPRAKTPLLDHWPERASTDLETIRSWWRQWPDAGAGILTGAPSGLAVLDVDGDVGEDSAHALIKANGAISDTVEALTGGGHHILFEHCCRTARNEYAKCTRIPAANWQVLEGT